MREKKERKKRKKGVQFLRRLYWLAEGEDRGWGEEGWKEKKKVKRGAISYRGGEGRGGRGSILFFLSGGGEEKEKMRKNDPLTQASEESWASWKKKKGTTKRCLFVILYRGRKKRGKKKRGVRCLRA